MTMLKQHNRKVQMQLVFHSLPSIAVSKRNELVDGSWAPQLVQFISQYFNCDVVTLPWMWAHWKPQANNRGWMQTIQIMGHSKGWPCYELMQSKNIPTSTVQPSSLGLLERLRSMSIASKLLSKNWLDNPRTSASLIWPVSRFGLTRIAWPSRWCQ